jgi:hypothetical protein
MDFHHQLGKFTRRTMSAIRLIDGHNQHDGLLYWTMSAIRLIDGHNTVRAVTYSEVDLCSGYSVRDLECYHSGVAPTGARGRCRIWSATTAG